MSVPPSGAGALTDPREHAHSHAHSDASGRSHSHAGPDGGSHSHGEPASYPPSREGSVVVDIGGDVGALIIDTPPDLVGAEIEISLDGGARRTHVAVRERRGDGPVQHAAVFPALVAGTYTVWDPHSGAQRTTVVVNGASVTRLTW